MLKLIVLLGLALAECQAITDQRSPRLLVEVSRHGVRGPKKIYPFTVDPEQNFQEMELTSQGA